MEPPLKEPKGPEELEKEIAKWFRYVNTCASRLRKRKSVPSESQKKKHHRGIQENPSLVKRRLQCALELAHQSFQLSAQQRPPEYLWGTSAGYDVLETDRSERRHRFRQRKEAALAGNEDYFAIHDPDFAAAAAAAAAASIENDEETSDNGGETRRARRAAKGTNSQRATFEHNPLTAKCSASSSSSSTCQDSRKPAAKVTPIADQTNCKKRRGCSYSYSSSSSESSDGDDSSERDVDDGDDDDSSYSDREVLHTISGNYSEGDESYHDDSEILRSVHQKIKKGKTVRGRRDDEKGSHKERTARKNCIPSLQSSSSSSSSSRHRQDTSRPGTTRASPPVATHKRKENDGIKDGGRQVKERNNRKVADTNSLSASRAMPHPAVDTAKGRDAIDGSGSGRKPWSDREVEDANRTFLKMPVAARTKETTGGVHDDDSGRKEMGTQIPSNKKPATKDTCTHKTAMNNDKDSERKSPPSVVTQDGHQKEKREKQTLRKSPPQKKKEATDDEESKRKSPPSAVPQNGNQTEETEKQQSLRKILPQKKKDEASDKDKELDANSNRAEIDSGHVVGDRKGKDTEGDIHSAPAMFSTMNDNRCKKGEKPETAGAPPSATLFGQLVTEDQWRKIRQQGREKLRKQLQLWTDERKQRRRTESGEDNRSSLAEVDFLSRMRNKRPRQMSVGGSNTLARTLNGTRIPDASQKDGATIPAKKSHDDDSKRASEAAAPKKITWLASNPSRKLYASSESTVWDDDGEGGSETGTPSKTNTDLSGEDDNSREGNNRRARVSEVTAGKGGARRRLSFENEKEPGSDQRDTTEAPRGVEKSSSTAKANGNERRSSSVDLYRDISRLLGGNATPRNSDKGSQRRCNKSGLSETIENKERGQQLRDSCQDDSSAEDDKCEDGHDDDGDNASDEDYDGQSGQSKNDNSTATGEMSLPRHDPRLRQSCRIAKQVSRLTPSGQMDTLPRRNQRRNWIPTPMLIEMVPTKCRADGEDSIAGSYQEDDKSGTDARQTMKPYVVPTNDRDDGGGPCSNDAAGQVIDETDGLRDEFSNENRPNEECGLDVDDGDDVDLDETEILEIFSSFRPSVAPHQRGMDDVEPYKERQRIMYRSGILSVSRNERDDLEVREGDVVRTERTVEYYKGLLYNGRQFVVGKCYHFKSEGASGDIHWYIYGVLKVCRSMPSERVSLECVQVIQVRETFLGSMLADTEDIEKSGFFAEHYRCGKPFHVSPYRGFGDEAAPSIPEFGYDTLRGAEGTLSFSFYNVERNRGMGIRNGKPRLMELFCGAGGMHQGFKRAGFEAAVVVDHDPHVVQTFSFNNAGSATLCCDIRDFNTLSEQPQYREQYGRIDHIHASPSCQGFSIANVNGGVNDEENNALSFEFPRAVKLYRPFTASYENVTGILMQELQKEGDDQAVGMEGRKGRARNHRIYLQRMVLELLRANYQVSCAVLKASKYGDPQRRSRLFLFVAKKGVEVPRVPLPTHMDYDGDLGSQQHGSGPNDLIPAPTAEMAIGNVMDAFDEAPPEKRTIELDKTFILHNCWRSPRIPSDAVPENEYLKPDHPAHTVRASRPPFHYNRNRCISVREAAYLQSFPHDYQFFGRDQAHEYRQVGNAVPVNLATAVAKSFADVLQYVS